MKINAFKQVAESLPESISVLIRGRHGIGKSQSVYQIAKNLKLDVIERRLSQMSEGDMIGLPILTDGITHFCPPDWIQEACDRPVLLFLDEINRGTVEVQQAAFQLVEHSLNGHQLHPKTRVYSAINNSSDYQVNSLDPAFEDRFWIVDLEKDVDSWIDWASSDGNIDFMIVDFIRHNPAHLMSDEALEPGKIGPSPRSWEKLDHALKHSDLMSNPGDKKFYSISLGFVGAEAAISFIDFCKNYDRIISAEDILNDFDKFKTRLKKASNEQINGLINMIEEFLNNNNMTSKQVKNFCAFANSLPSEMFMHIFTSAMRCCNNQKDEDLKMERFKHNLCPVNEILKKRMLEEVHKAESIKEQKEKE